MKSEGTESLRLWYERAGQGRPVVFLHAFAVTGAMWQGQEAPLAAAGHDVLRLDQRGHGRSSAPPGPYTITQMAADVHHLVLRLRLHRPCLVGLSMGGRVAMRYALDFPDELGSVVLVSSKSEPALEIEEELGALARQAERGDIAGAIEVWYRRASYERLAAAAPELIRRFVEEWRASTGAGFAGAGRAIIEMEPMSRRLREIRVPTLALAGQLDAACHPFVEQYRTTIPQCDGQLVPGAGHFINVEQPQTFNDLLLGFLRTL